MKKCKMKIILLSLLFFYSFCISVFGQELQSPQINQNAIFANPGLAGSKGQTRVCTSLGRIDFSGFKGSNYSYQNSISISNSSARSQITNGTLSIDGLAFKKSIGIGAYAKFNTYGSHSNSMYRNDTMSNYYYSGSTYDLIYSNIETGIMIAPKFYLASRQSKNNNKSISPSISFGIRGQFANQNSYRGYINNSSPIDSAIIDNRKYRNIELSNITFGFLYNTKKGYSGLKLSFTHNDEGGFYFKPAFLFAHTFSNKKIANPIFSFTPQLYFGIFFGTNNLNYYSRHYRSPYHVIYNSDFAVNLDFRYKIIIFGLYSYDSSWKFYSAGYTLGVLLNNTRIVLNVSPSFSKRNSGTEIFLSANFLLKSNRNQYK